MTTNQTASSNNSSDNSVTDEESLSSTSDSSSSSTSDGDARLDALVEGWDPQSLLALQRDRVQLIADLDRAIFDALCETHEMENSTVRMRMEIDHMKIETRTRTKEVEYIGQRLSRLNVGNRCVAVMKELRSLNSVFKSNEQLKDRLYKSVADDVEDQLNFLQQGTVGTALKLSEEAYNAAPKSLKPLFACLLVTPAEKTANVEHDTAASDSEQQLGQLSGARPRKGAKAIRAWASKKPNKSGSVLEPEEREGTETDVELEETFPGVFEPVNHNAPCENIKRDDM